MPAVNPRYERPEHLAPLAKILERAERESVRALVSVPPQHGKSDLLMSGVARLLRRQPWRRNAYASFADRVARKKSRQCRDMALAAGVPLRDDAQSATEWETINGGGLFATSIGGVLTSMPVDGLMVIDDPHKNREEAESALARERVYDWYTSTAKNRVHPGGSIIVCHTRWHPDDLIGRLAQEGGWEVVSLPAIREDGQPLWHQRPLSYLEQFRKNDYDWHSLFMCSPRPRGTSVFRGVRFYTELPKKFRVGKGTDLAYTAKTRADSSCAVVLLCSREPWTNPATGKTEEADIYYVVQVKRAQCEVPDFARELAAINVNYPIGAWHWFCSTTEKGVAQLVTADGVTVDPVLATADKFVRAQPVATAWNEGRVLVPKDAPWLKAFVDELGAFTGVSDRHDDQVDALASAFASCGFVPAPVVSNFKVRADFEHMGIGD